MHRPCTSTSSLPVATPGAASACKSRGRPCWYQPIRVHSGLPSRCRRSPITPLSAAMTASRSQCTSPADVAGAKNGSSRASPACRPASTSCVTPRMLWYTSPVSPRVRPGSAPPGSPSVPSTDWCTPSATRVMPVVACVARRATARRSEARNWRSGLAVAALAPSPAGVEAAGLRGRGMDGGGMKGLRLKNVREPGALRTARWVTGSATAPRAGCPGSLGRCGCA